MATIIPIRYRRCVETARVLEQRALEARLGKCIGIVYAAMYEGREYIVDIAGEPERQQTFTLGMVRRLDHELNVYFLTGRRPLI